MAAPLCGTWLGEGWVTGLTRKAPAWQCRDSLSLCQILPAFHSQPPWGAPGHTAPELADVCVCVCVAGQGDCRGPRTTLFVMFKMVLGVLDLQSSVQVGSPGTSWRGTEEQDQEEAPTGIPNETGSSALTQPEESGSGKSIASADRADIRDGRGLAPSEGYGDRLSKYCSELQYKALSKGHRQQAKCWATIRVQPCISVSPRVPAYPSALPACFLSAFKQ